MTYEEQEKLALTYGEVIRHAMGELKDDMQLRLLGGEVTNIIHDELVVKFKPGCEDAVVGHLRDRFEALVDDMNLAPCTMVFNFPGGSMEDWAGEGS